MMVVKMLKEDKIKFTKMILDVGEAFKIAQYEADLNSLDEINPAEFTAGYFENFINKEQYVIFAR